MTQFYCKFTHMHCTSVYEKIIHFGYLLLWQHISSDAQRRLHLRTHVSEKYNY